MSKDVKEAVKLALQARNDKKYAVQAGRCILPPVGCGQPITDFKDEVSRREYRISGLCQKCQDEFFAEE